MKKNVVIIIIVVFIASIVVVNFFGLEIKEFDGIEYVTSIQCDDIVVRSENAQTLTPSGYFGTTPIFQYDFIPAPADKPYTADKESILGNPNRIELNYVVFPHTADNREVVFEYDEEAMEGIAVFRSDIKSLILLKANAMFTITIRATDGSNVSTSISVIGINM